MPKVTLTQDKVAYSLDYSTSNFPGNCGYHVCHLHLGDKNCKALLKLPREDRLAIEKAMIEIIVKRVYYNYRLLAFSFEYVKGERVTKARNKTQQLYSEMIRHSNCVTIVANPTGNHGKNYQTILGIATPYDLTGNKQNKIEEILASNNTYSKITGGAINVYS